MSEFGGLWKHEKAQHAFAGLGSAAVAAAVALGIFPTPVFKFYCPLVGNIKTQNGILDEVKNNPQV